MPVGVPKIPFRLPGDEEASWLDLNRLYWERLLFLGDEVDDELANLIAGLMIFLGIADPTWDIFLFINSPGGFIIPGVLVFDTMQWVNPIVHTIGMGMAASIGALILVGGEITQRVALPYAWRLLCYIIRVMIHQPLCAYLEEEDEDDDDDDFGYDIILEMVEFLEMYNDIIRIFAERTGAPIWAVIFDMERDVFMSAEEAQDHGIVDLIGIEIECLFRRALSA
uniref:ATP-dependent Clp protease proteolytic subunit n=1 Tax=Annona reticulata TaxID=301862 RepID=A0A7G8QF39_ANNRE|nr:ATP-dependent Clp protease proteolytic subunit [Annona reticulata]YP_009975980.1 ATP-dependent Clp protease proteolytic subunit [Annona reticulata]QNK05332.1 ATP-dependent Clp protease proteolytic subunit [Annona reticulata]QNK05397.1 ATP-dependent Clp protease proteolytic subunit [Annona reticulata]